jgi:hypothetical protein
MKKYMILACLAIGWTVCSSCTRQTGKPAARAAKTEAPKAEKTTPAAPRRLTDAEYRKAQKEWLGENAKKDSVVSLKSGLQYKILRQGDGKIPRKSSKVCIHYEGRTTDGSLFDSSYERQMALTMNVSYAGRFQVGNLCSTLFGVWKRRGFTFSSLFHARLYHRAAQHRKVGRFAYFLCLKTQYNMLKNIRKNLRTT